MIIVNKPSTQLLPLGKSDSDLSKIYINNPVANKEPPNRFNSDESIRDREFGIENEDSLSESDMPLSLLRNKINQLQDNTNNIEYTKNSYLFFL